MHSFYVGFQRLHGPPGRPPALLAGTFDNRLDPRAQAAHPWLSVGLRSAGTCTAVVYSACYLRSPQCTVGVLWAPAATRPAAKGGLEGSGRLQNLVVCLLLSPGSYPPCCQV